MAGGRNTSQNSTTTRATKKKSKDSVMDKNNGDSLIDPAISLTPANSSTPESPKSPAVVTTNNPRELKNLIILLQNKVDSLTEKVDTLDTKVSTLENALIRNQAALAISQITSSNLRGELDKHEQYSRRNCIVFDNIKATINDTPEEQTTKAKTILTENFALDEEIVTSFDKAHPIGPVTERKQSYILRFSKHSVVRRIYNNRKTIKQGIKVRPSLTKSRASILKSCQKSAEDIKSVKFVFSDIEGNLKICFVDKKLKNRNVHTFGTEEHFANLILDHEHSSEFPPYDFDQNRQNPNNTTTD